MTGSRCEDRPLRIQALLGVGTDGEPGETRITRGDNFLLCGGSKQTHERMVETVIRFNEKVSERGKNLRDINTRELAEITRELADDF